MIEFTRMYVSAGGRKRWVPYNECVCGASKRRKSAECRKCQHQRAFAAMQAKQQAKSAREAAELRRLLALKWKPGACKDCGIRPIPAIDAVDREKKRYVVRVVDDYCDDCRLRRRREAQYDEGTPSRLRAHTPMGPISNGGREAL